MSALVDQVRSEGPALSRAVIDQMYENPFWNARFGSFGAKNARQDGDFHISYLVESLSANDPEILRRYARWLQRVLVTRGMCTRHLADNYRLLREAIARQSWPEKATAEAHLQQAEQALRYDALAARSLQDAAEPIARDVVQRLRARQPDWFKDDAQARRCEDDCRYHLSYLADALALQDPAILYGYVKWVGGFLEQLGVPRAHLVAMLDAINEVLGSHLPAVASECAPWLREAAHG